MPLIQEEEINFDAMTDEELTAFLAKLTEESSKRRPKLEAKTKAPKMAKAEKKQKDYIKIEL